MTSLIRKVSRGKPLPADLEKPGDFLAFMGSFVEVTEEATRNARGLGPKIDRCVDEWIASALKLAKKVSIVARIFQVGAGPRAKVLARTMSGRFLPKMTSGETFKLTGETRRTGGVLEVRGLKNADGSVTIELGGYVLDKDKAFPGGASAFRNASKSNDFRHKVRPASEKSIGTITLDARNAMTGKMEGYEILHLSGHGFGDEARDGLMYGPSEFNQFWQNTHAEEWIRQCREFANRQGGNLAYRLRAKSVSPRVLKEKELESLKDAGSGATVKKRINQSANEHVIEEVVYELMVESLNKPGVLQPFVRLEFRIPPPWEKERAIQYPFSPELAHQQPLPDI